MRFSSLFPLTRSARPAADRVSDPLAPATPAHAAVPATAIPAERSSDMALLPTDFGALDDDLAQRVRLLGEW